MKDPIKNYEQFLLENNVLNETTIATIRKEFKEKIESELAIGYDSKPMVVDTEMELEDVYASRLDVGSSRFDVSIIDNSRPTSNIEHPRTGPVAGSVFVIECSMVNVRCFSRAFAWFRFSLNPLVAGGADA